MTMELKLCPFCGGEAESDSTRNYRSISTGNPEKAAAIYCTSCSADMTWCYRDTPEIERDQVMTLLTEQWNTRATASLEGDAVERVARIINPDAFCKNPDPDEPAFWRKAARHMAREKARAILATGLVPDEAAIRADSTANLISIIADIREKTGLGGKPMLNELADAIAAEIDQRVADEREKCAAQLSTLRARVREVVGPFAKAGELFGPRLSDEYDQCIYSPAAGDEYSLCGDHLRAARQLMEEVK